MTTTRDVFPGINTVWFSAGMFCTCLCLNFCVLFYSFYRHNVGFQCCRWAHQIINIVKALQWLKLSSLVSIHTWDFPGMIYCVNYSLNIMGYYCTRHIHTFYLVNFGWTEKLKNAVFLQLHGLKISCSSSRLINLMCEWTLTCRSTIISLVYEGRWQYNCIQWIILQTEGTRPQTCSSQPVMLSNF